MTIRKWAFFAIYSALAMFLVGIAISLILHYDFLGSIVAVVVATIYLTLKKG